MSQWVVFAVLALGSILGPVQMVEASSPYVPTVQQVRKYLNERLTEPATKALQQAVVEREERAARRNITIIGDDFVIDGKPLQIVSGSLHYFRLPAAYWRDRLKKMRAAGLNSVATYVEWSFHEPEERQYSFTGDQDIVNFIKIAAEEGLYVLLRVGPYICAERDLGGFPYWLIGKYPNIKLRSTDKDFMAEARIWVDKLFEHVKPLLYGNGGPIILVQVENEYGSFGGDMAYKLLARDMLQKHVESNAILYTTDGSAYSFFHAGAIPNTLTTIDFNYGTNVTRAFLTLRRFMPHGPLMNSEFYTGWLTHWGESFGQANAEGVVKTLGDILDFGASVNFYMFFGGTNFGYTAGANHFGTYVSDITSYDYDSPLSEAGDPTPKYYMIRDKLKQYDFVDETIEPPIPSPKGNYGPVNVTLSVSLLSDVGRSQLGKKYEDVSGTYLPTFEKLRQRGGLILYETRVPAFEDLLTIRKPHDIVHVFVDGVLKGRISRLHKIYSLPLKVEKNDTLLSLLVESHGRINYGNFRDHKGIISFVETGKRNLNGKWTITGYPLETFSTSTTAKQTVTQVIPAFYEGHFTLPAGQDPLDTFLDTAGWGKGYVWINGHNLGRYWPSAGPQITLYVPGVWLNKNPKQNYIQILELEEPAHALSMTFIDYPILNKTGSLKFEQPAK